MAGPETQPEQAARTTSSSSGRARADEASDDAEQDDFASYSAFSRATRTYLTYLVGVAMTLSTLTTTVYFPLIPALSARLAVSVQAVNLTVTVYAVAQALAPALCASLADRLGRRPVLLALVALYAAASLGLALNGTRSYAALLVLRALQSVGGSPLPAVGYGVAADLAPPARRGALLGPMMATCNGLSVAGPVVGGAISLATHGGVRWVFVALLLLALLVLLAAGFSMPETARTVVGDGRRVPVGVWRTWWSWLADGSALRVPRLARRAQDEKDPGRTSAQGPRPRARRGAWRPAHALASFRIVLHADAAPVLWMVAASYAVYYAFQVATPVVFADVYGYNELQIGFVFLPGLAGMTIGGMVAGRLVDRHFAVTSREHEARRRRRARGEEGGGDRSATLAGDRHDLADFPIEAARYRHVLVFVAAETAVVAAYGWAVLYRAHPAVPIVLQFLACALSTLLSHTASALLLDLFPARSSSAYAAGQVARCGLGAASAAVLQPLIDALGRGWYFTLFALFVGGSSAGVVVLSRTRGMRWRRRRQWSEEKRDGGVDESSDAGWPVLPEQGKTAVPPSTELLSGRAPQEPTSPSPETDESQAGHGPPQAGQRHPQTGRRPPQTVVCIPETAQASQSS